MICIGYFFLTDVKHNSHPCLFVFVFCREYTFILLYFTQLYADYELLQQLCKSDNLLVPQ